MQSIYDFIKTGLESVSKDDNQNKDFYSGCMLPDHQNLYLTEGQVWVPGAYEGIVMRSNYSIRRHPAMNYLLALKVKAAIKKPTDKNYAKAEKAFLTTGAIAVVDSLISFLTAFKLPKGSIAEYARKIATTSPNREVVKVGIALLGNYGDASDVDLIKMLGMHEEFTFYAAPALVSLLGKKEACDAILELAKKTDGWGKAAALYELDFEREDVREYLLKYGARNSRISYAVTANMCATKGQMADKLDELLASDAEPDIELIHGLTDIMEGLTQFDRQNDSINDYKYGNRARASWKELIEKFPSLCDHEPRMQTTLERMI